MTDFQKQRLEYFIKAAKKNEYVQLGPGDLELLEMLTNLEKEYWKGYGEGFSNGIDSISDA